MPNALLFEPVKIKQLTFEFWLGEAGFEVQITSTLNETLEVLAQGQFDLIVLGFSRGKPNLEVISRVRKQVPGVRIVVTTPIGAYDQTVKQAIEQGANTCVVTPNETERYFAAFRGTIDGIVS